MSYGPTDDGFVKKPLQVIRGELESRFREAFGNIDTSPDSVFGRLIGKLAKQYASVWEAMEALDAQRDPDKATGVNLDAVARLTQSERLPAAKSQVVCVVAGEPGGQVGAGSTVETEETEVVFEATSTIEFDTDDAIDAEIEVVSDGESEYTITVDGNDVTYTKEAGDTLEDIAEGLVEEIGLDSTVNQIVTATQDDERVILQSIDQVTTFELAVSAGLSIAVVGSPGEFLAVEAGRQVAPAGTVT